MAEDHYTEEGVGFVDATRPDAVVEARKRHHLASADPERDGTLTGPAHEEKYGLDRAEGSAAYWRAVGVHPTENRALEPGEDGFEDSDIGRQVAAVEAQGAPETASGKAADEKAAAPRASDNK